MHYIRFLRAPEVEQGESRSSLKLVLTVTTDLGDAYLAPHNPIELAVIGAYTERKDGVDRLTPINLSLGCTLRWRAGMRVLKFEVPLPAQQPVETIQVRPASRELTALSTTDIISGGQGRIMAAYADIQHRQSDTHPASVCFRSLRLPTPPTGAGSRFEAMQLEEDIGMSIARRIWDGGIAAMSFVAAICSDNIPQESSTTALPTLRTILRGQQQRPLNILELGCGIGTLGIGMARILSLMGRERATTNILMTDVPEAEARARANMARQSDALREGPATLDFEPLNWEDGQHGIFGEKVRSCAWDLIMLSDCTYNTDTLQPLVKTLTALHSQGLQGCHAESSVVAKVLLATKPRHSSESIAFDLMAADGWVVREKTVLPLPVLDGEGQSVEVYLLEKE